MLTKAQRAALPGILREIVDCDRRIAAVRAPLAGKVIVGAEVGATVEELRKLRALRQDLSTKAAGLYGTTPLRGDTGPGRPTAARA